MFDVDPDVARSTRIALLDQVAREGWVVAGGHVTGFGHVQRAGGAYSFTPAGE